MGESDLIVRIAKRTVTLIICMFILSAAVFFAARLAPGDPLRSFYGDSLDSMTAEEIDAARQRLGLDSGLAGQYATWLGNAFRGDLGISFKYKMPVIDVIRPLLGNTLILGVISFILIFVPATMLALLCIFYEDRLIDRVICKTGTALFYIPGFWLGTVLVLIFSVKLGWLPAGGAYDPGMKGDIINRSVHLILPVTVMVTTHLWYYAYMIRNKLSDEVRKDYVLFARAKGLSRGEVLVKHCLRNIMPTIISFMAVSVPHITGGAVVVEAVFSYPGIGALAVESAKYHDYDLLMVLVMITGAAVFVSSFIAQAVNEVIDPRMKETGDVRW